LNIILQDDQDPRGQLMELIDKYGNGSPEVNALSSTISNNDYFNLIKVKAIIKKYGWLGPDVVGTQGNEALFLVIQHADLATQKEYLPMMRQAVIDRKASGKQWALLEDRLGLATTGSQIYGSQVISANTKGDSSIIAPIRDEINVDKRRKAIGMEPLEDYAQSFGIKYKLPAK
jgi:hypothetical protein